MKIIILAAGRGKRMGELGKKIPKCMIEYEGETLIARNLRILINNNINNISIVVGYHKEKLIEHVKSSFPKIRITFIDNDEYLKKENIFSVWCAKNEFNNNLVMMDADLIFNDHIIKKIIGCNDENFIVVRKEVHENEMIVLMKNNKVIELSKNPIIQDIDFDNMYESVGIIKLSKVAAISLINEISIFVKNNNLNQYYEAGINQLFDSINFSILMMDSLSIVEELDSVNDIARLKSSKLTL
tara:strand:- start:1703 stop:2428 length:726 start_codon:yes stop_codon:yes gene_type:complete